VCASWLVLRCYFPIQLSFILCFISRDSLVKSNPNYGPGWIAAGCLEEHAGCMVAARKLIKAVRAMSKERRRMAQSCSVACESCSCCTSAISKYARCFYRATMTQRSFWLMRCSMLVRVSRFGWLRLTWNTTSKRRSGSCEKVCDALVFPSIAVLH
jgi:hypothetical protein